MSDKRKCRFTIETGPISVRSYRGAVALLENVIGPSLRDAMRADVALDCGPIDGPASTRAPESRINARAPRNDGSAN